MDDSSTGWIVFGVIAGIIILAIIIGLIVYFVRRRPSPPIIGLCTAPLTLNGSNSLVITPSTDLKTIAVRTVGTLVGYAANQPVAAVTLLNRATPAGSATTTTFVVNSDNTVSATLDATPLNLKTGDLITVSMTIGNACNVNTKATATGSKTL